MSLRSHTEKIILFHYIHVESKIKFLINTDNKLPQVIIDFTYSHNVVATCI